MDLNSEYMRYYQMMRRKKKRRENYGSWEEDDSMYRTDDILIGEEVRLISHTKLGYLMKKLFPYYLLVY